MTRPARKSGAAKTFSFSPLITSHDLGCQAKRILSAVIVTARSSA